VRTAPRTRGANKETDENRSNQNQAEFHEVDLVQSLDWQPSPERRHGQ
jgi:hypothetical protein